MSEKTKEREDQQVNVIDLEEKIDALIALASELATTDNKQAVIKNEEAAKLARAANYRLGLAKSLNQLSQNSRQLGHYDVALSQGMEARSIFQEIKNIKGEIQVNLEISELYFRLANYAAALDHGTQAYNLSLESNDIKGEASALSYMSMAHMNRSDKQLALELLQKSLVICREHGYKFHESTGLNNLAMLLLEMDKQQDALSSALESLKLLQEIDRKSYIPITLDTISLIYMGLEDLEKALEYAFECLRTSKELNQPRGQGWALLNIGKIFYKQQDDRALDYLLQAQALAQQLDTKLELADSHKLLAQLYEDMGSPEDALINFKQFHAVNEELFNTKNTQRIQSLKMQYQVDIAQKEADVFEQKNVELENEILERKQMQAALQEREEDLSSLLEFSPDAIGVVNTQTGLFENINSSAEKLYGLSHEDLLKVGLVHMSPELQPDGRLSGEKAMEKIKEALDGSRPVFEWLHINAIGKEILCEINLVGLPGVRNHLVRFSATDISERKQAEKTIAKRAAELQTVAEVSTIVAAAQDKSQLLQEVVDLTKSRFNFYHAHVYLMNEGRDALLLTAGAGKIGHQMVAEGHAISLGQEQSLVAQAARTAQGVTENDVRTSLAFLPHHLLPETRSEMAVPMIVGDRVIGVLDVHADETNRFTEQDVAIQTTLATQIAIALENAHSLEQAQEAIASMNELTRRLTREGWQEYLDDLPTEEAGFIYDASQLDPVLPVTEATGEVIAALAANGSDAEAPWSLECAIMVHGEAIGQLAVIPDEAKNKVDSEMAEIITAVTEQLGAHIENLRLNEQTQTALAATAEQARRLSQLNRLSVSLSQAKTLSDIYQVAVVEVPNILSVDRISLSLFSESRQTFEIVAIYGEESDLPVGTILDIENSPMLMAIQENRVIKGTTDSTIKTALFAPLFVAGHAAGTITIGSKQKNGFGSQDESLLLQVTSVVSSRIESMQLLEKERSRAQGEQVLRKITERVRGSVDVETIMKTAVSEIGRALGRPAIVSLDNRTKNDND